MGLNDIVAEASFVSRRSKELKLIMCAFGICFSFWFYGILQEKLITKSRLGGTFMIVTQTFGNYFVALTWKQIETKNNNSPVLGLNHPLMLLTSACYVFAMIGSNEAMRFVPYPVAVLAKSCKLIPTMTMGTLIERRSYSVQQWSASVMITVGICLFNYARLPQNSQQHQQILHNDRYWKGMALLFMSLIMDGFLGACQGILKRSGQEGLRPPTAVETMLWINFYSLFLLFPLAVTTGQWSDGTQLLMDNVHLRYSVLIMNIVVSMGQIFIFLTITWYSSLMTTTITTTRKFFTILFSVLYFNHSFSVWQWLSIVMVFSGIYLSIVGGKNSSPQLIKEKKYV